MPEGTTEISGKIISTMKESATRLDFWDFLEHRLSQHFSEETVSQWIADVKELHTRMNDSDVWPEGEADFKRFLLKITSIAIAQKVDTHT